MTGEEKASRFAITQVHGQRGEVAHNHIAQKLLGPQTRHVALLIDAGHFAQPLEDKRGKVRKDVLFRQVIRGDFELLHFGEICRPDGFIVSVSLLVNLDMSTWVRTKINQ